jgi:hypothetical protein
MVLTPIAVNQIPITGHAPKKKSKCRERRPTDRAPEHNGQALNCWQSLIVGSIHELTLQNDLYPVKTPVKGAIRERGEKS